MLALSVSNLSKRFMIPQQQTLLQKKSAFSWMRKGEDSGDKAFWALQDINFDIKQGEVVGIIGANGAGKSTLLKIISQILNPTEGKIEIYGRLGSILEVGMGFHPDFSGRDNIHLSASIFGMTPVDLKRRFDQIVAFAEIGEFIDVPVKHYSSGMYMRLAFAVCAHLTHEILILDEVLAVGDASFQRKCMGKMQDEMASGRTVLFVSHNLSAVNSLCTRCIYIDKGRVIFDGTPADAIYHYTEVSSQVKSATEWNDLETAPGNELYKLVSVRILDPQRKPTHIVDNDKDFYIEITYNLLKDAIPVGITAAILDSSHQVLFGTLSNQEEEWHNIARKKGVYVSTLRIHKDLLNKGIFPVSLFLWTTGYTDVVRIDQTIEIEVNDTGSIRSDYFGGFEGPFMPRLEWQTKFIGSH